MNASPELSTTLRAPLRQRLPSEVTRAQQRAAVVLYLVVALIIVLVGVRPAPHLMLSFVYMLLVHAVSVLFSVRLPGGIYTGLISTSLAGAALTLGYRQALFVAPLTALIAIPLVLILTALVRSLHHYRPRGVFETLWQSAAMTLALLPSGWLYGQFGTQPLGWPIDGPAYLAALSFVVLYFSFVAALETGWLLLGDIDPRRYWGAYGKSFVMNGLIAALLLAPALAISTRAALIHPLPALIPYTLLALWLGLVTRTQLRLSDRLADLRVLSSIGQALNANLELDDLLQAMYREINQLLDASNFYLALTSDPEGPLHFALVYEEGKARRPFTRAPGNGLTDYVVRTCRPLLLNDVEQEAPRLGIRPSMPTVRSYAGVPIIAEGDVIGVMAVRNFDRVYAYTPDELRLLETIAASAAVALQNARLYEDSRRRANELRSLNKVAALLSTSLDLDTVLETVCRVVVDMMQCQKAAVFLVEDDGKFRLASHIGLSARYREQSSGLAIWKDERAVAMQTGELTVIEDVLADERFRKHWQLLHAEGIRAVAEAPLRTGDDIIGALTVYYDTPRSFEETQLELLNTLAGQVSMAVNNAHLFAATNARRRELETLYEAGRAINESLSLPAVLRAVAKSMIHVLDVETVAVLLAAERGDMLHGELWMEVSGRHTTERPVDNIHLSASAFSQLPEWPAHPEYIRLERNASGLPDEFADLTDGLGLLTGVALPLVMHGELFGMIVVGCRSRATSPSADTLRLARALADHAAVAIQNARLFRLTDVALTRRVDELAALEAISQRMTRRLDLNTVIEQVVSAAALATGAQISELLLLDESGETLEIAVRQGPEHTERPEPWPAHQGVTGRALMTGQTVLVPDVSVDPDYIATSEQVRSELAVPIVLDNRRLGVLNLESYELNAFDQEQARFISNLAEHAAVAIQNAQLFQAVQQRAEEFQTLRSLAVDMLSSTNLRHTLRVIARAALERAHAQDVHIYLYDQESRKLRFGTSLWADGRLDIEFAPPRVDGITATVARTGEPLVITKPEEHPLLMDVIKEPGWGHVGAMVSMPLKRGDEVLGVFNIAFDDRAHVTQDILHFLDLLASQAAVAIANARLAEETRTGRDRLQAILNSIHDGILMFDMDGRLVLANPRMEQLVGVKVGDYLGEHFTTIVRRLRRVFGEDSAFDPKDAIQMARRFEEDPTSVSRRTYKFNTPTLRVIDETTLPIVSHDAEVIGRLFILRDVTHEYEMETYRQEMSNMLVHDLRSPLAGVITGLHMALDEASYLEPSIHRDTIEASVQVALTSANTLLRLVEQILDVNKLEAGEMSLMMDAVSLKGLAEQACSVLAGTAAEAEIDIQINAPDDLPPVFADEDKIKRVFLNLLDNALRYTPSGGQVRIHIREENGEQVVSIVDTGKGIPPELHERVFERFFQGDTRERQRGAKGSGLGLTFCKLAVEAHGGRIWVTNGPEGGAAFYFTLPSIEE